VERVNSKHGASVAVNTATKNTSNMLLRKYCSVDDTNPKRAV